MKELLTTSDAVRLSYLRAVLADAGIETVVLDAGAGSLWGAAIPSRLMVDEEDLAQAKRVIAEAERPRAQVQWVGHPTGFARSE